MTPVLSVVTVCYEAKEALSRTMESLLSQTWTKFEYVVADGGSSDGSAACLEEAVPRFAEKGISLRYVSEPDRGIYDAMNKGARLAEGRWLLFLNAGDLLAGPETLERFFSVPSDAQILYGDTLCVYQGHTRLYPALSLDRLPYEMAFCHQSAFVSRKLMLSMPYDVGYRVCADHHFFLRARLSGATFEYRPLPVSVYEIAGFSDTHKLLAHREQLRMQRELGLFRITPAWLARELRFYAKQTIKSLFGQKLIDKVRERRLR
ncbi:MAG: glycosyltransferase family 2 protein [Eubacteriales bacterium]|nr:glycosyltransferase family 2 protein [Eubacteriales bacterium]